MEYFTVADGEGAHFVLFGNDGAFVVVGKDAQFVCGVPDRCYAGPPAEFIRYNLCTGDKNEVVMVVLLCVGGRLQKFSGPNP